MKRAGEWGQLLEAIKGRPRRRFEDGGGGMECGPLLALLN